MAEYTGTFETGVAGNTVSVLDPGSVTPWNDRAFDATHATLQYSNVEKYGALSCRMVLSATPQPAYVVWGTGTLGSSLTSVWGRAYLHYSGLPNTLAIPVRGFESAVGRAWEVVVNSSGLILVRDSGGNTRGTGTVPIATGQWIRIEFHAENSATAGVVEAKLFNNPNSTTINDTIVSTGSFSTLTKTDLIRFGEIAATNASRTIYLDNLLLNDTGYPGPAIQFSADVLTGWRGAGLRRR